MAQATAPQPATKTPREYIREQAAKWKVPEELAFAVVERESSGIHEQPGALTTSPQGAQGFFQLLPSTAYGEFGLDPREPGQNIEAGIRYLRQALEQSEFDPRRAAAYYHGGPNLAQHGPKTQEYATAIDQAIRARLKQTDQAAATTATPPPPPSETVGAPPPEPQGTIWQQVNRQAYQNAKDMAWNFGSQLQSLNPVALAKGLYSLATTNPLTTAEELVRAHRKTWEQGEMMERQAETGYQGAGYLRGLEGRLLKSAALVPFPGFGPGMERVASYIEQGEPAKAAGAVTDVGLQVLGPKMLGKGDRFRYLPRLFKPEINPAEEAAIQFGKDYVTASGKKVPIDVATASGDPFALKLMRSTEATARGSKVGRRIARQREEVLPEINQELAAGVSPTRLSGAQAGRGVQAGTAGYIDARDLAADAHYNQVRSIVADPQFTQTVQVGQRTSFFPPGTPPTPIMQTMQLPIDMRPYQARLRPIVDDIKRQMPAGQQLYSKGLQVLENILAMKPFEEALTVERNLGAAKAAARGAELSSLRNVSQGTAAQAVDALSDAVDLAMARAGPQAQAALAAGRAQTVLKYAAKEVFDQLNEEPVGAFRQATAGGDVHIEYLQQLRQIAPQAVPGLGRAVLEDIFRKATEVGGWDYAKTVFGKWKALGEETRQILYGGNAASLDDFFLLQRMLSETPNPSGTALTITATGSFWNAIIHPLTGVPALLGAGWIAKVMNSAEGVRLLTEGLTIPASGPRAAAWLTQVQRVYAQGEEEEADEQAVLAAPVPRAIGTPPPRPPSINPPRR